MNKNGALEHDPDHLRRFQQLLMLDHNEVKALLLISDYMRDGFIPSEVLVSLIKVKHGKDSGLLNFIAIELNKRIAGGLISG